MMQPLLDIMEKLRDPQTGCPWDKAQNFSTIVPFTLEEAYEVADAIEQADFASLPDELGDLLFQVVFYCQLGKEQGMFDFETVVNKICDKLTRRHPHVFATQDQQQTHSQAQAYSQAQAQTAQPQKQLQSQSPLATAQQVKQSWEAIKQHERAAKQQYSLLDDIPLALPALNRSVKIQKRVAKVGFDWPDIAPVVAKVHEEIDEVMVEVEQLANDPDFYQARVMDEMGDLLFAVTNMARHLGVDPEQALRQANTKFETRFRAVEILAHQNDKSMLDHSLEELDTFWEQVKAQEQK